MGRNIEIDARRGGGAAHEILFGEVTIEATALRQDGTKTVFPAPTTIGISNGTAVLENVDVSPAGPEPAWAYRMTFRDHMSGRGWSEMVGVPTGTTAVKYPTLPRFTAAIPPETTKADLQNWVATTEAAKNTAVQAAATATAPTDAMVAGKINDPASLTGTALSAAIDESAPAGFLNAARPAGGLTRLVADANYYDPVAFKYYSDVAMTIPATDNSPALRAMVNHAYINGGGIIEVPRGKFAFRSPVVWRSRVSLRGTGKMVTSLYAEGVLFSLIMHVPEASPTGSSADDPNFEWYEDCSFSDFAIDNKGLSYTGATVSGKAIFLLYMKRAVFRDLVLVNTCGTALGCDFLADTVIDSVTARNAGRTAKAAGVLGYGGNSGIGIGTAALAKEPIVISNCFTYDCGNFGVFVETQLRERPLSMYAKVTNCHSEGNHKGFGNKGSGGTQFIGCTADNNVSVGFSLSQGSFGDKILGGSASSNGDHGVFAPEPYAGELNLTAVKITDNGKYGVYVTQRGINPFRDFSATDCDVLRNGWSGVNLDGAIKGVSLVGNRIRNNGLASVNSATNRGIIVAAESDRVTVVGNTICDTQATKTQVIGIQVHATATNVLAVGNNTPGYTNTQALSLPADATVEGNTSKYSKTGTITIQAGSYSIYIDHFLGKIAESIQLTPLGDESVYVLANEANRVRIGRGGNSTTGALQVMWAVRRTP